jgi:integrase
MEEKVRKTAIDIIGDVPRGLAIETGLRAKELHSLAVDSFDFENHTVTVDNQQDTFQENDNVDNRLDERKLDNENGGFVCRCH